MSFISSRSAWGLGLPPWTFSSKKFLQLTSVVLWHSGHDVNIIGPTAIFRPAQCPRVYMLIFWWWNEMTRMTIFDDPLVKCRGLGESHFGAAFLKISGCYIAFYRNECEILEHSIYEKVLTKRIIPAEIMSKIYFRTVSCKHNDICARRVVCQCVRERSQFCSAAEPVLELRCWF